MVRWDEFVAKSGSLAQLVEERVHDRVVYLATVRKDGSPRVHPVTPRIHDGRLFVRMYPTSPKVGDLYEDPRYALHSQVKDSSGAGGEVAISGRAVVVEDESWIAGAFQMLSNPDPSRYVVFEFDIEDVRVTLYEGDHTRRERWQSDR